MEMKENEKLPSGADVFENDGSLKITLSLTMRSLESEHGFYVAEVDVDEAHK